MWIVGDTLRTELLQVTDLSRGMYIQVQLRCSRVRSVRDNEI